MGETGAEPGAPVPSARRFSRFASDPPVSSGSWPLPEDGLCLSAFVLLSPPGHPEQVLVGRLNPRHPWGELGALDPRRVELNAEGWMLPSCHLLHFEPPDAAAARIVKEQLGLPGLSLKGPQVFSETYAPRRHPNRGSHWDLEFLYRGTLPRGGVLTHPAWAELRSVDPARTPRSDFTRSHDEVLELAGYRFP